jgi:signal transduction histidine kinase
MSRTVEPRSGDLIALRRFVDALTHARLVEEVFTSGLHAMQEIFNPNRAFVAMRESRALRQDRQRISQETGDSSTLTIPVHAGDQLVGQFVLCFDRQRKFTDNEIEFAEILALQAEVVIRALQAQRMKAEYAAMAAHELRAPLTAIMGGTLLIKSGKAIPRALDMIERNTRLQEKLIEELLHVSQVEAGKVELQMKRLDLTPLLAEVIDEIQLSAADDGTVIQSELQSELFVNGDAQRLRQVFSNLLSNAVRCASPNGEVRIRALAADGFVHINVIDNGIGISAEHLPHIFDRFRQVRSSERRSHGGLGLGLAIVQDLVTMQGGTVTAESPGPGQGAKFCVRLFAAMVS